MMIVIPCALFDDLDYIKVIKRNVPTVSNSSGQKFIDSVKFSQGKKITQSIQLCKKTEIDVLLSESKYPIPFVSDTDRLSFIDRLAEKSEELCSVETINKDYL
jgi:hypothetical protein